MRLALGFLAFLWAAAMRCGTGRGQDAGMCAEPEWSVER